MKTYRWHMLAAGLVVAAVVVACFLPQTSAVSPVDGLTGWERALIRCGPPGLADARRGESRARGGTAVAQGAPAAENSHPVQRGRNYA